MYVWDTTPAEDLGGVNAAVAAVLASGITADKVRQAVSAYSAAAEIVDSGAKNVLHFDAIGNNQTSGSTFTSAGVKFTLNADYSVTAERITTDSGNAVCNLRLSNATFYVDNYCNDEYVITGCPADGSLTSYNIAVAQSGSGYIVRDFGNGAILIDRKTATNIFVSLRVQSAFTGSVTFKPMICSKTDFAVSTKYQPYRPNYQELYERVVALEEAE